MVWITVSNFQLGSLLLYHYLQDKLVDIVDIANANLGGVYLRRRHLVMSENSQLAHKSLTYVRNDM